MDPKTVAKETKNHKIVTELEWMDARQQLLDAEKKLTHQSDEVAKLRQQLPWRKLDKDYIFDTDNGKVSLPDLFGGRSQLMIYHFMYGPEYKTGCPTCSSIAEGFNGFAVHLAHLRFSRLRPAKPAIQRARSFWFFMYFGQGMNPKDVVLLQYKNIAGEYLQFVRAKTEETIQTPLVITVHLTEDMLQTIAACSL